MSLTALALKHRTTVYVLIVCIVILGVSTYRSLPLESSPDVEVPILIVSTVYPGVAPEDIERLVTNPLERRLASLKDLKEMTSSSSESVSIVKLELKTGVDLDTAYQKVRDKVDQAKPDLPADAEDPRVIEINLSEFPIMLVTVAGDYPLAELKTVAERLEDRLEQIPGVLGVDLTGGIDREIQIFVNPAKLEHYGIGVGQVINRIQQEHRTTPAGKLELGRSAYSVRIPAEYRDVSRMEDLVLKAPGGHPVRLGDVGRVVDGFAERETISRLNGTEGITLVVRKRTGENIVSTADEVRRVVEQERPTLPAGTTVSIRQDQSEIVRDIVSDLENSIITGLILVVAVLLFAMGVRNAFFVAIAIPLSMLITFVILSALGITLNMVVLFSLILALGMLVDGSIVVVENIYRHVAEGESRMSAALTATREVAWPIIASTATTLMVFAPLLFWPGMMGEFMVYLPITVIAVLTSALFVALIINPVIASGYLTARSQGTFDADGVPRGRVLKAYQRALAWSLSHPKLVLGMAGVTLVGTVAAFGQLGAGVEFFPKTTPPRGRITVVAPQGTVLKATDALVRRVEAIARTEPNVKDAVANVGASALLVPTGEAPTNQAVVELEFKDRAERTGSTWDTIASLRRKLAVLPGAEYRINVEEMGPPTGAPVSVELSGPDFATLATLATRAKELIGTVPGTVDLKDDYETGKPELRITIDRDQAMRRKVNTASISLAARAALGGVEASVLREGDEEHDIVVRYDRDYRRSISDVLDVRVAGEKDVQVALRDVARVEAVGGLGSINHIDRQRTIAVTGEVSGRSSTEVMADVARVLKAQLPLPAGYQMKLTGASEEEEESAAFLSRAFGIGLMLMLIILITQFNSVQRPAIILASVVLSIVGVLVGLMITQGKFSIIMTGLGVISLAGVVVNNAIVLVAYADQLRHEGLSLRDALLRAGVVRFRPVILTAITTILGLLPMALGIGIDFASLSIEIGAESMEYWGPMAQAVSFGLAFATVLTLILVPVMYLSQESGNAWIAAKARALIRLATGRPHVAPEA